MWKGREERWTLVLEIQKQANSEQLRFVGILDSCNNVIIRTICE